MLTSCLFCPRAFALAVPSVWSHLPSDTHMDHSFTSVRVPDPKARFSPSYSPWHVLRCRLTLYSCTLNHFSHVQLFVTLWIVARQAPLSTGFSRQEYWSGLPYPPSWDLSDSGIKPMSLICLALAGRFLTTGTTWEAPPTKILYDLFIYLVYPKVFIIYLSPLECKLHKGAAFCFFVQRCLTRSRHKKKRCKKLRENSVCGKRFRIWISFVKSLKNSYQTL